MEQVGYQLVDETGAIIQEWGGIWGQCPGVPNPIYCPNGTVIYSPEIDVEYDGVKLKNWMIDKQPDIRFYNSILNNDGTWTATPKDLAGLKTTWTAQFKQTAYSMLLPSDWLIIRKQENNTDIPADWTTYREAVRTKTASTITALEAATDIDAFIAVVTNVEWPVSPDAQPMVEVAA